jgi:hypothetical protein
MKPFLSIFGERSPESPLEGLPVLFPHGTPSRDVTISREDAPTVKRSMTLAQFVASFNEIAVGAGIISRTEAWKNPHVRRCVEANAQAIASLPFAIYSGQEPQKKHWWLDFVQHPNEFLQMSEHDLKESCSVSASGFSIVRTRRPAAARRRRSRTSGSTIHTP